MLSQMISVRASKSSFEVLCCKFWLCIYLLLLFCVCSLLRLFAPVALRRISTCHERCIDYESKIRQSTDRLQVLLTLHFSLCGWWWLSETSRAEFRKEYLVWMLAFDESTINRSSYRTCMHLLSAKQCCTMQVQCPCMLHEVLIWLNRLL